MKALQKIKQVSTGTFIAVAVFVFCLLHAIWCFSVGWNNTINDHHSFRQSQTALTSYYLAKDPFGFAYETPVLGKPWSIPMEFPIYQFIAARVSNISGSNIDHAGRFVASIFFILMLIPIYTIFRFLGIVPKYAILFLSILLVSPFYLFWSRTFMIESTVLFFSFCYLSCSLWGIKKESLNLLISALIFGVLAGVTKVTTWAPFFVFSGLWVIRRYLRAPFPKISMKDLGKITLQLVFTCLIPLLFAFFWVRYSDSVKMQNPLGSNITSAALSDWNYGTVQQKLSPQVWDVILNRIYTLFGLPFQALLILVASCLAIILTRRRWCEFLILLTLFIVPPIFFTNLHFVHDYYMYANGIFLLGAVGCAVIALLESGFHQWVIGWILLVFILWSGCYGQAALYLPLQQMPNSEILQVTDYLKKNTPEKSVIIILGAQWNPLVPYYSQRRALMIPEMPGMTEEQVQLALNNLKGEKIGALLVCGPSRYPAEKLIEQAKAAGLDFPIMQCGQLPLR
jgi:hypothetical protein